MLLQKIGLDECTFELETIRCAVFAASCFLDIELYNTKMKSKEKFALPPVTQDMTSLRICLENIIEQSYHTLTNLTEM
jgi:hypothetical protein